MLQNRLFTSVFMMLAMAGVANAAYNGTPTAKANFATETINNKTCYKIGSAEDLYGFAAIVNGGEYSACGMLTQNITVNENVLTSDGVLNTAPAGGFIEWTPIGTGENWFNGTFDGQGFTISGLYFNDVDESNVGLFGYVSGEGETVSIGNVGVEDSYFNAQSAVGGVVGSIIEAETVKIENVYNAAVVAGSWFVGGIAGEVNSSFIPLTLNMVNVYSIGSIIGESDDEEPAIGGLVGGLYDDSKESKVTIKNSYNYGDVVGGDPLVGLVDFPYEDGDKNVSVTNSYYLGSSISGAYGTVKSVTEFADGTVYAALHSGEGDEDWHQYKNDAYPTFAAKTGTDAPSPMHVATLHYSETDSVVIAYTEGTADSLLTTLSDGSIVVGWYKFDDLSGDAYTKIAATENGDLNFYAKAMVKDAKDNCYEIADADMLFKFADLVNNQNDTYATACAKLTADIVVNENVLTTASGTSNVNANGEYIGDDSDFRVWTPIGILNITSQSRIQHTFDGSFDGQGHTISGLFLNRPITTDSNYSALFGLVGGNNEVSIKNVGIEDSYFAAQRYTGGIVAYSSAETLKIENCYNASTLYGINGLGGLVGELNQSDKNLIIENSYNFGTIKYYKSTGGIPAATGALAGNAGGNPIVTNSYYLEQENVREDWTNDFGTAASSTAFSDGTVAILLHGTDDKSVWGQKVETDNHPNFYKGVNGEIPVEEGPGVIEYQQGENGPSPFTVTLHYGEYSEFEYYPGIETPLPTEKGGRTIAGWCNTDDCSGDVFVKIPTDFEGNTLYAKTLPVDEYGFYEIASADDLYLFAEFVNSGNEPNAKAKLMKDIVVNENVLTDALGNSKVNSDGSYNGTAPANVWTPIGYIDEDFNSHPFNGVFDGQGHTISGLYYNDEKSQNIGLFGVIDGTEDGNEETSIKNVGIKDSYFNASQLVASILGQAGENSTVNIENVYSTAVVVGGDYAGGVVGDFWGNVLNMNNVYNAGEVYKSSDCIPDPEYGCNCDNIGGLIGEAWGVEASITNSFNYGYVAEGEPLVGYGEDVSVSSNFFLSSDPDAENDYGIAKSAEQFAGTAADGNVLDALRAGEGGSVWIQGDKYPTIDVNASNTIVLDWTSAADSTTLADAGYTNGAMVIVKDGKQFYADGAIYEGILSAAQVAAIGSNKLYPISGVELETVNGKLVATLNGDSQDAVMIPTDVHVDKVIYERNVQAMTFKTMMLPFTVPVSAMSKHSFYKFKRMAENDNGRRYVAKVSTVTGTLEANTPYIMIDTVGSTQVVFDAEGGLILNTTKGPNATSSTTSDGFTWTMKGVYEYKVWEKGNSELGSVYGFAGLAQDGFKIGQFAKLGDGAEISPMRVYMLKSNPQPMARPGFKTATNVASAEVLTSEIDIEIDDSEVEENEEKTLVLNRIKLSPAVVKSDRWFDLRGRALNGKPTTKGTYYHNGQKVIIK